MVVQPADNCFSDCSTTGDSKLVTLSASKFLSVSSFQRKFKQTLNIFFRKVIEKRSARY